MRFAVIPELGDVRVVEGDRRPCFLQLLDDTQGGTLAVIVYILLVCHAEHQHSGAVQCLAVAVEYLAATLHGVFGHVVVYHHGSLYHRCMEAVLARLPGEIIGVQGNAMPAQPRSGIECGEAERLGLGCLYHFPKVDAHAVAQDGQLVNQPNVDVAVGVLQNLGHLRHGRRRNDVHLIAQYRSVHGGNHILGVFAYGSHHFRRVLGFVNRVAGIYPFGRKAQIEILAALQARPALKNWFYKLFGSAGIGCGLQHHDGACGQMPGY